MVAGTDPNIIINETTRAITACVVALMLLCVLGSLILERLNNSYWYSSNAVLAIALGFASSLPFCGKPDHIVYETFDTTLFLYLMPPILFESGYGLNHKDFFRNIVAILALAFVGTTISCLTIGGGLFLLAQNGYIDAVNATSPQEAMMFGAVMAATDSVATLSVLGSLNVDPQLYNLVFGESVLNDPMAIVLFDTFKSGMVDRHDLGHTLANFLAILWTSIGMGILFGLTASLLTKRASFPAHPRPAMEVTIMLCVAYLSYMASDAARGSGLMTIFLAGGVMAHYARHNLSTEGRHTMHNVTRTLSYLAETFVFLYFGFSILPTVTPCGAPQDAHEVKYILDWPFVGWTFVLCVLGRALAVFPITAALNATKRSPRARRTRIDFKSMLVVWYSGLRGAVSFALALSMQSITPNARYILPCTVLIVLVTNICIGHSTAALLQILQIRVDPSAAAAGGGADGGKAAAAAAAAAGEGGGGAPVERNPLHVMWRIFDDHYLKPYFGGRSRRDIGRGLSQYLLDEEDDDAGLQPYPPVPTRPASAVLAPLPSAGGSAGGGGRALAGQEGGGHGA